MSWIKLDDKFHRNAKVLAMSDAAHRVYVDALSFCGDVDEPTGYLSEDQARSFLKSRAKPPRVVAELVELNAWERVAGGFLIHDFEKYLPKTSTQRVRDWRERKRHEAVTATPVKRHRNVSETPRNSFTHAHARATTGLSPSTTSPDVPVPEPVPVPDNSHGDLVRGLTFQQAAENLVVPIDRDVTVLCEWLLAKRGDDSFGDLPQARAEREQAKHMLELLPIAELVPWLDQQWQSTDTDDRPSSLKYFWTRLQDQQHAALKQQRPHATVDAGLTKLSPARRSST